MSDNLYFIAIIAKALQEPDIKKALRNAFHEIKKKGRQKQYAEGFKNFELFMDAVCSRHEAVANDHVRELIAELATGTFEGSEKEKETLSNIICLRTEWMAEYLAVCRWEDHADLMQETLLEIAVLSEKGPARYVSFPKGPSCQRLDDIIPGNYKLELANTGGWTLWEGQLTAKDLISSEAHEGENLQMAAETEDIQMPSTSKKVLLDGDLILRTYAGPENGTIEIELTR